MSIGALVCSVTRTGSDSAPGRLRHPPAERRQPWGAVAAGTGPGLIHPPCHLLEGLGRPAAHRPAIPEAHHPSNRGVDPAADQKLRPTLARGRRADRAREAPLLTCPHLLHLLEQLVHKPAASVEGNAGSLEIVGAGADPDAQGESAA